MAEADPLQRIKYAAERAQGPLSVETQRQRHFAALDLELGLDAETKRRRERASRPSRWPSLTRIIGWLMLFTLFLTAAMTIRLLYDGTLTRFITAHMPKPPTETGWMLSRDSALPGGASGSAADAGKAETPLPSFVEPLPLPPSLLPQAQEADEEGDDPAEEE